MADQEQIERAEREFRSASDAVKKQVTVQGGATRTESRYGQAYQRLVTLGVAPPLRKKYRR